MEILLLGPVQLRINAATVDLGSDKERTVLAVLAAEAGQPVSIEKLIFRLWDDTPPDHARDGIHSYISRIRRRLRPAGPGGPRIDGRAHTYVLNCPAESVDWLRFQHLVATRPIHDDNAATLALRQADDLWRAEPLAGLDGAWAEATRQAMLEQRLRATVLRITATLRLGDFAAPLSELAGLAREHPTDETVHSLLMLAYHGSSRSTEALHVHQRLRQNLLVEYGTRPGAEITRLHRGILTQIPAADLLRIPTAATATGPVPAQVTPRNLPHQPPLVGRTGELRLLTEVTATADTVAVIALETVTGMAGVGKTALAVHTASRLAHRYPDAQLYLNLRAHTPGQAPLPPAEALPRLLRLLGTAADQIPPGLDEQTSLWRHLLAERKVVIVLDDATDAGQIAPLLPDSTSSLVLITSRRHLAGLPHARTIPLDVLPTLDAIALFRSFAGHQRTTDLEAVRHIVGLCDHLPLAIEVVATRFQARTSWTLATLTERLSRHSGRLAELHTTGKSVRNAFDLSYQALTPQQRHAFSLLSLHPGSDFTADAAAAMLGLTLTDTEQILEELLSCHLIAEPVADRFRYHDLLREYARSLAPTDRERIPALHRLMAYYHRTAAAADRCAYPRRLRPARSPDQQSEQQPPHMPFAGSAQAKAWLKAERDNLLAAIDNATVYEAPLAAHLGYALAGFLEADCHWQEAEHVLQRTAAHWHTISPPDPDARALALLALAALQTNTGAYPESAAGLQQVLSHARAAHRPRIEAEALRVEGMRRWHLGEHQAALTAFRRSLLLQEEIGDQWNQARVTNNIAVVSLFLQRHDDAMQYFRTALEKFAVTGDELSSARILNNIGDMYFRKGDLRAARRSFEESLTYLTESGNRFDQATARSGLADTLTEMREPEAALDLYEQSLQEFQSLGDHKGCAQTLIGFAEAHHKLGDTDEAVRRQTAALAFATGIGALPLIAEARLRLGRYHHARGSSAQATHHWEAATDAAAHAHDLDRVTAAQSALLHLRATTAGPSAPLPAVRASIPPLDPDEMGTVRERLLKYARNLHAVLDE